MSPAAREASGPVAGLVRVTLVARTGRVDVAAPGGVPLAELLPLLAARTGTTVDEAARGLVVRRLDGTALHDERPLAAQGVRDGDVLLLGAARADATPPEDDVAVAVAALVSGAADDADPSVLPLLRRGAASGGVLLATGLAAVGAGALPAVAAAGLGVLLAVLAAGLGRRGYDADARLSAALAPLPAAGAVWAVTASPLLVAATFVLAAGGSLLALPRPWHPVVAAPPAALVLLLGTAAAAEAVGVPLPLAAAVLLALVPLAAAAAPGLVLAAAGPAVPSLDEPGAPPTPLDDPVRRARAALLAVHAGLACVLVVAAPVAATSGWPGVALVLAATTATALRARHHRSSVLRVLCAAPAAVAATAALVLAALHLRGGAAAATAALAAAGALLLAAPVLRPTATAGRRRVADVLETGALVLLPALLVVASGVPDLLRGAPW